MPDLRPAKRSESWSHFLCEGCGNAVPRFAVNRIVAAGSAHAEVHAFVTCHNVGCALWSCEMTRATSEVPVHA